MLIHRQKFSNTPSMTCNSSFHRGRDTKGRMNTAEIVVSKMQSNSGFQVRQLFAERIRQSGETAHLHSHREVLPFDKGRADVLRVRIANSHLGYDLDDFWWGVPRIRAIVLPVVTEQLHELS